MSAMPNTPPAGITKDDVATSLANAHRSADPAITGIFRIEQPGQEGNPAEPIKLLEINPNTTASGIMPVRLTPHAPSGIYFPSVIVEVHPSEVDAIEDGTMALPNGWQVDLNKPL